jgi:hypothetical protein
VRIIAHRLVTCRVVTGQHPAADITHKVDRETVPTNGPLPPGLQQSGFVRLSSADNMRWVQELAEPDLSPESGPGIMSVLDGFDLPPRLVHPKR